MKSLEDQIAETRAEISQLHARLTQLIGEKRLLDSRAFITANSIKRDEVELSSGNDRPWFTTIWCFSDWMKKKGCKKRWAEWNGVIYHTSDLFAGRLPDMPGRIDDLEEAT